MELLYMLFKLFAKKPFNPAEPRNDQELLDHQRQNTGIPNESGFIHRIWDEAGTLQIFEQIDTEADWRLVEGRLNRTPLRYKKIPWGMYFFRIAALFLLTAGLTFGFYRLLVSTGKGDSDFTSMLADKTTRDIILPDGSTVSLNVGSSLTYRDDFGSKTREVILEGEALFHVIPSVSLPFKVFSGESLIEVTGTRFSVREINGTIHVAVISGTVVLSSTDKAADKINISANHSGYLLANHELKVEEGLPANVLSWKTGNLLFDQTPLDSALIDIARHFNRELVMDIALKEKITAEFYDQPLHEILEELNLVAGLQFDTTNAALIVRK